MVMGRILPIVLVTLCLLLYGEAVRDGGRGTRVADLPVTPRNATVPPVATSKTVASVVAEDILQSGSAPGTTNTSSLPTAPSYDSYLFGTSEDNGTRKTSRDKHAVLTTPRTALFDEHHAQVSEGIRQRLEELDERFHSSHGPSFETRLSLKPGNGTTQLDYSNRFSLVFNETYDPPENVHRETVMENGTRLDMETTMLVHKEYQELELASNLSTRTPTIVGADVKKKKKIIILLEPTTELTQLPQDINFYHSTEPPGDENSTIPLPDVRGRSISSLMRTEEDAAEVTKNDSIVGNVSSSEKTSLRSYSTTERFPTTSERSSRQESATEGARGGRMLINENSTNSLGAESSQVAPSPVAFSVDQGSKMGVRTKTALRRLNRTESEWTTQRFNTETVTSRSATSPTAEWRSRSRAYPQRRPFAAAAVTTSDSEEESTTRSSRRPAPLRRPPVTLATPTVSTTIMGLRPTWRRQPVPDNGTDNNEGNDLKPNRGRGSIRYGNSELTLPATATAWTLVSLRSPPSSNSTRLVRQPDTENITSTRGRKPVTQSSMQENRVSMVQVLAPLLVGEHLVNVSRANDSSSTEPSLITTTMIDDITTTLISDMVTTEMSSKEEFGVTEAPSNISSTEFTTTQYDSTTLGTDENSTAAQVTTTITSEATSSQNSSESGSDSLKTNITIVSTTFVPEVDYVMENYTNKTTKLSNLEEEPEVSNTTTVEPSTESFHPVTPSLNTTNTISVEENTTVGNSENTTEATTALNTTPSPETTTMLPQEHNITSEPNSTIELYSTNDTMVEGTTTSAGYVTKLVDVDDDLLSVTPVEAEEIDDSTTSQQLPSTATTSMDFGEDDGHVFTQREDPEEEILDQPSTTTSTSPDFTTTTPPLVQTDINTETTTVTEHVSSSSVSEIDWEQHTTVRPPKWDSGVSVYLHIVIESTWEEFCNMIPMFRTSVTEKFKQCTQKEILAAQVAVDESQCSTRGDAAEQIVISMYLTNADGEHDALLTTSFGSCFGSDNQLSGFLVERVEVMPLHEEESAVGGWGVIAAIAITCVGAVCLLIFLILMVILRKRQKKLNYGQRCTPVSLDAYSLDSVSICGSTRRKGGIRASKRSYGNAGFDDPGSPSHPMGFAGLANFVMNRAAIDEEYSKIPQVSASVDELPEGAETRNRYANVIPLPETRVTLNLVNGDPLCHYINANFVRGPKEERKFYIACQAPLPSTVTDFWRMIWEQQSRAVLMLTDLVENGVEKCADYLPPSEVLDCHRLFGDFQVTLKKREVKEKYIISTLQLKNLETNSWREVTHLWYVGWPAQGVPAEEDTASLIAFLLEARPHMRGGPTVVHCSPGTGRTGTVIACDLCIRDFETTRIVDVPRTVARIRRDRAGAVQTRDQYAFVYQVINLYGMKLTGGALESI